MTASSEYRTLGKRHKIIDGSEKITGTAQYTGDLNLPGMLHARPVLSPYAHANIKSIDRTAAMAVPGVVAVLIAADLPTRDRVVNSRSSAVLAHDKVLFRGHPVVVVVAETETAAKDGADAVIVDYEPLPVLSNMADAIATNAALIWPNGLPKDGLDLTAAHAAVDKGSDSGHRAPSNIHEETKFGRGNVDKAIAGADIVLKHHYTTPMVHQGYLEPHAVVAEPHPFRGEITVYTSTQGKFGVRDEVARLLGIPKSKVRVIPMVIGGAFGAKYGILDPLAAAVAWAVRRPVKIVLTRSEDFLTTTPSPAMEIDLTVAAYNDGRIAAIDAVATIDNGVFPFTIGGIVGILIGGYYKCDNVRIVCREVLTHKLQGGAYRAPGAPSATFAIESSMDELARALGRDPLELRLQNCVETGDLMGNGDPWPSIGMRQCLETLQNHPWWQNRTQEPNTAWGMAAGGWLCGMSPAASVCAVDSDGAVRIHVGSVDISGVNSSLVLVAAEILDISPDRIQLIQGDTRTGPRAGPSGGSQTTYSVSGAVAAAARVVRQKLIDVAAEQFEANPADLELRDGVVSVKGFPDKAMEIGAIAELAENKAGGSGPIMGEGTTAISENAPGFVTHLVKVHVDPDTGHVTPLKYLAIQDVGFALNPLLVEGQIHGGVAQGLGWALHEAMVYDDYGQLLTASFMDYSLPGGEALPDIEVVMVHNKAPFGPFGARGIGEPPITAGAAAVANAVRAASGARVLDLPLRDERVWKAMQQD